jgi:hypothetical protein
MSIAWAGGLDDWRFRINGVDVADLNARSVPLILAGAALSFGLHEIGHIAITEIQGKDWRLEGHTIMVDGMTPGIASAGFLTQLMAGQVLTIVNKGDLSYGFNMFTLINSAGYALAPYEYGDTRAFSASSRINGAGRCLAAATAALAGALHRQDRRPADQPATKLEAE